MSCAMRAGGFSGQLFENAIELRERLEPGGEGDFTDSPIGILKKVTRFFESGACNIIDKIYAGDLLEFFAQMIGANVDSFRHLAKRKFFGRMLLNQLARFPDLDRLGSMAWSNFFEFLCGRHLNYPQNQLIVAGTAPLFLPWQFLT
jgi:hypothetical protein